MDISIGRLQNTSYDLTGNITSFGLVLSREAGGKVICQSWVGHATGESGKSGERALNRKFLIHSLHSFIAQLLKKQRDTNKWFPQCFPFPQWFPQWFESALFHSLVFLNPLSGNFYYCVIKTLLSFFLKIIIEKNWSFAITKLTAFVDVSNTLCFVTSFAKYIVSFYHETWTVEVVRHPSAPCCTYSFLFYLNWAFLQQGKLWELFFFFFGVVVKSWWKYCKSLLQDDFPLLYYMNVKPFWLCFSSTSFILGPAGFLFHCWMVFSCACNRSGRIH